MDATMKTIIWKQFGAAIDMLVGTLCNVPKLRRRRPICCLVRGDLALRVGDVVHKAIDPTSGQGLCRTCNGQLLSQSNVAPHQLLHVHGHPPLPEAVCTANVTRNVPEVGRRLGVNADEK